MTEKRSSTRRSFLKKSALLAVPLAAATPAAIVAGDDLKSRLARLENEAAIRHLHHSWLCQISNGKREALAPLLTDAAGTASGEIVRSIAPDHNDQPDLIQVAADGRTGQGRFSCIVSFERAIAQHSTLAQMAHAQGSGFVSHTERRVLEVEYAKAGGGWTVSKAKLVSV